MAIVYQCPDCRRGYRRGQLLRDDLKRSTVWQCRNCYQIVIREMHAADILTTS